MTLKKKQQKHELTSTKYDFTNNSQLKNEATITRKLHV